MVSQSLPTGFDSPLPLSEGLIQGYRHKWLCNVVFGRSHSLQNVFHDIRPPLAHARPSKTTKTTDDMPTVKLVVIGSSGVGKTSLRGKYIEGRFSNGYRATIGADFITKTLPHPTNPEQSVTLQIWDTAGQERFSSLSTAFFRGADAALLMFDVNAPETMAALKKWWKDFCDRAPLEDDAVNDYCCVVVGNKIDMLGKQGSAVSESEALEFLDELVPPSLASPTSDINVLPPDISNGSPDIPYQNFASSSKFPSASSSTQQLVAFPPLASGSDSRSASIAINSRNGSSLGISRGGHSPKHHLSKSRSRSSSRFYAGTMTTTHTTLTIYHTPSSSMFDVYQSARSSPEPWAVPNDSTSSLPAHPRQRTMTMLSTGSTSSGSAVTITPSLFAREAEQRNGTISASASAATSPQIPATASNPPLPPERGPKLFFTSAKTGEGVSDVFEYIARRVVQKWDYEEWVDARTMHFREASALAGSGTIRLQREPWKGKKLLSDCCTS